MLDKTFSTYWWAVIPMVGAAVIFAAKLWTQRKFGSMVKDLLVPSDCCWPCVMPVTQDWQG